MAANDRDCHNNAITAAAEYDGCCTVILGEECVPSATGMGSTSDCGDDIFYPQLLLWVPLLSVLPLIGAVLVVTAIVLLVWSARVILSWLWPILCDSVMVMTNLVIMLWLWPTL